MTRNEENINKIFSGIKPINPVDNINRTKDDLIHRNDYENNNQKEKTGPSKFDRMLEEEENKLTNSLTVDEFDEIVEKNLPYNGKAVEQWKLAKNGDKDAWNYFTQLVKNEPKSVDTYQNFWMPKFSEIEKQLFSSKKVIESKLSNWVDPRSKVDGWKVKVLDVYPDDYAGSTAAKVELFDPEGNSQGEENIYIHRQDVKIGETYDAYIDGITAMPRIKGVEDISFEEVPDMKYVTKDRYLKNSKKKVIKSSRRIQSMKTPKNVYLNEDTQKLIQRLEKRVGHELKLKFEEGNTPYVEIEKLPKGGYSFITEKYLNNLAEHFLYDGYKEKQDSFIVYLDPAIMYTKPNNINSSRQIKSELNYFYNPATDYIYDEELNEDEWNNFSKYQVEEGYYLSPQRNRINTYTVYSPEGDYLGQVEDSAKIINIIKEKGLYNSRQIKSSYEDAFTVYPWSDNVIGTSDEDLGLSYVVEVYGDEFVNVDDNTLNELKDTLVRYFDDEAYVRDWNINNPDYQIEDVNEVVEPEELDVNILAMYFDYEAYGRDMRLEHNMVWDSEEECWVSAHDVDDNELNDDKYIFMRG